MNSKRKVYGVTSQSECLIAILKHYNVASIKPGTATRILKDLFRVFGEELDDGSIVTIYGVGSLVVNSFEPRNVYCPKTGTYKHVPATRRLKCRAHPEMHDLLNSGAEEITDTEVLEQLMEKPE